MFVSLVGMSLIAWRCLPASMCPIARHLSRDCVLHMMCALAVLGILAWTVRGTQTVLGWRTAMVMVIVLLTMCVRVTLDLLLTTAARIHVQHFKNVLVMAFVLMWTHVSVWMVGQGLHALSHYVTLSIIATVMARALHRILVLAMLASAAAHVWILLIVQRLLTAMVMVCVQLRHPVDASMALLQLIVPFQRAIWCRIALVTAHACFQTSAIVSLASVVMVVKSRVAMGWLLLLKLVMMATVQMATDVARAVRYAKSSRANLVHDIRLTYCYVFRLKWVKDGPARLVQACQAWMSRMRLALAQFA